MLIRITGKMVDYKGGFSGRAGCSWGISAFDSIGICGSCVTIINRRVFILTHLSEEMNDEEGLVEVGERRI